ncbi:hypothetical protein PHLCEN_2v5992 [Hermanssonia centrifuga]|uniref:Plastocyanin-like domain-containing protein n=1 Tax=Hermanssonia centrifuga TaxID=98765 RepID=A0A2R6P0I5_9APHY|nr:hypothetical protein PHLCEN_2v5992 [Hermanssonia centrifuga]
MFAFISFHVVAGALLPMAAYAAIVSTDLLVTENNVAPDGFSRQAIFTEGQFPAPLIQGDKVIILAPCKDTIITLADWYHTPTQLLAIPPAADSTLINGLGRYVGGPASPLAVITVEKGKRYDII